MEVNNEIFEGYQKENHEESINEIVAGYSISLSCICVFTCTFLTALFILQSAYDLLDTNRNNFNVTIWYNSTYKFNIKDRRVKLVQVPRSVNLVKRCVQDINHFPYT